jgi:hypothetical protein
MRLYKVVVDENLSPKRLDLLIPFCLTVRGMAGELVSEVQAISDPA